MKLTNPLILLAFIAALSAAHAGEPRVLDSMDAATFSPPKEKGKVELVEGKDGKALKFSFDDKCLNTYAFSKIKGAPDWDTSAGLSFWVKGDGSDHLGAIQFVWNEDFGIRYGFCFPIDGTEWKKITMPWRDLIPETANPNAKPLGTHGNAPSKLGAMWVGKWWYWKNYAAHSFTIDDIRLEAVMPVDVSEPQATPALQRVSEKLKAGKPITVVTMGDSLTDYNHWANKPVNWPTLFKEKLTKKFGSAVTVINPAIGGTELRQNLIMMPRWLKQAPEPDLVTICFGFNDFSSGMRGAMMQQTLEDGIDRVRRMTHGKSDILLITTCRAVDQWDTMAEMAEAFRKASAAKGVAVADIYNAFGEEGKTDKEKLFCRDKVHLGPAGHEVVAKTVFEAIEKAAQ